MPLAIVVLAELPARADTLALRLMGAGALFRAAFDDLCTRYGEAPRGEALYEIVIQTHLDARRRGAPTESIMVDTSEARALIEKVFTRGLNKGLDEGRSEGLAPLAHLFARKLDRSLTERERESLIARLDALGPDRLGDVALDLDGTALALWLADPNAR